MMRPLHPRRALLAACCATAALATACDSVPPNAVTDCQTTQVVPDSVATDILFVVDDSGSMSEEQANLASNLGAFIDTLAASTVKNDFRIGVTNTSVEDYGATATTGHAYTTGPSSGVPYPAGALIAVKKDASGAGIAGAYVYDATLYAQTAGWGGNRILDRSSPTLVADFKANVLTGLDGTGKEQPLRAARLALSDRLADANAGFLRKGARLAVVVLSDEDDCSDSAAPFATSDTDCHAAANKNASPPLLDPVGDFASFLLGPVGGEVRDVSVLGIAGFDPVSLVPSCGTAACANQSCSTAQDEGDRFALLAGVLGSRMRIASICDASFRDTLVRFAESLAPSSVPLTGAPADWRMLVASVTKATGTAIACPIALEGSAGAAAAGAVYAAPVQDRKAQLTFQNACKLDLGDRVDIRVVCAQ